MTRLDDATLNELVGRVLSDVGGAVSVPLVRIGDALGLCKTLKEIGPATPDELAAASECALRCVREWLSAHPHHIAPAKKEIVIDDVVVRTAVYVERWRR